jgi:hypothetical protein
MQRYHGVNSKIRRPFWLPASNYYILAAAAAIAVFFLIWGVLHDGGEETPFIPAGIAASMILALAAVTREVVLRRARNRFIATQRLENSLRQFPGRTDHDPTKLTLERNAAILKEISRKSEAAKVLGRLAESHREVFELCDEYLAKAVRELPNVGAGSPRLAALRRGTTVVGEIHHYHLLQWAEIQSKSFSQDANKNVKLADKLASAQQAVEVIDFALKHYPEDPSLLESVQFLRGFAASIQVSHYIEKAERASFKGNNKRAISLYKDALFHLSRGGAAGDELKIAAEKINQAIERLQQLPEKP